MRFRALGLALLAAVGCSDASSPSNRNNPSALAQHIDSLYVQACAQAGATGQNRPTSSPYYPRCQVLSVLLALPASGAMPSPLVVNKLPGNAWRGAVVEYADTSSNGAPHDSAYVLVAYADPDVHTAFIAGVTGNGVQFGQLMANDTVVAQGYANTFPVSTVSRGGRCSDTPGLANPLLNGDGFQQIQYGPSICQLSTFSVSWNADFVVLRVDSAYAYVDVPTQTVSGITLTNSPWGFYAQRKR